MNRRIKQCITRSFSFKDNGQVPNSAYPVLLYKNVLDIPFFRPVAYVEALFKRNNWYNFWKNGIYEYTHYHSNTHEVLGIYKGKTTLLLGGEGGMQVEVEKGDVLLLPAGVACQNLNSERQVKCVCAYPNGIRYDMKYGKPSERPLADDNIKKVSTSVKDPVFGSLKGISEYWNHLN